MKESIEDTKLIIRQIKLDLDNINAAISQADVPTKLNAVAKNLEQLSKEKNPKLSVSRTSLLSTILWCAVIVSLAGLVAHDFKLDVNNMQQLASEMLTASINEQYTFPVKVVVSTAAILYPIVAFFLSVKSGRHTRKVVLVDKGCQATDTGARLEHENINIPELKNESVDESMNEESSIVSLTDSDEDNARNDDEVMVHYECYVKIYRLVGNEWKTHGSHFLKISSINNRHCMVFRNDIGRVHLNLPIAKGMKFENVNNQFIRFASVEEGAGVQCFMLQASTRIFDTLHSKLVEFAHK